MNNNYKLSSNYFKLFGIILYMKLGPEFKAQKYKYVMLDVHVILTRERKLLLFSQRKYINFIYNAHVIYYNFFYEIKINFY